MKRAIVLCACAWLAACSPFTLLNSASPDEHFERFSDIAYGTEARQVLDIYRPRTPLANTPLVIFFYGGGWNDGAKEDYEFVASALTEDGMTVVIPDYRLYPEVTFPAFVEDGAAAVAWTIRNAERYGASRDAVFLMGHSAGAHLAASLALDRRYLERLELGPEMLSGLIGLSGPYDFLPIEDGYLLKVFPEATHNDSQPVNFVTPGAPPTLLIHGDDDDIVVIDNSNSLARRLRDAGVRVTLKPYTGVGHARVVAALAPRLEFLAATLEDSRTFILEILAESGPKS